jgi:AraC family transcriptional regulator, glycine betaine-responsive activator
MRPSPADRPDQRPDRFVFLLLDNFTLIAFASALEPLRIANRMAGRPLYEWIVASEGGGPVACSNGTLIAATAGLDELPRDGPSSSAAAAT